MSRLIKLTPETIKEYAQEFEKSLSNAKLADGKITYTRVLGEVSRKATVFFTDIAWLKMQALIQEFDKEVAWHGVAKRGDDEAKDEYYITDILVYPQTVSGASVEMDVSKYDEWIRDNIEDERFFNIGMQGHSHVNMGTTPSGVDLAHQEEILKQLTDDMFYIFMIWNKSGSSNVKIYDLKKNVLFETKDVDVMVMEDGYGIDAFLEEAKDMVQEKKYAATSSYSSNNYYGSSYYVSGSKQTAAKSSGSKPKDKEKELASSKDDKKVETKSSETGKKYRRKGKKSKAKSSRDLPAYYYDDDYYYSGYGYAR